MFIQLYETEEAVYLQAVISIDITMPHNTVHFEKWRHKYVDLFLRIKLVEHEGFSVRISDSKNEILQIILFIWTKERNRKSLERYITSFTELNDIVSKSAFIPENQEQFDDLLMGFPRYRVAVETSGYVKNKVTFLCDFTLFGILDALIEKAQAEKHPISYQINFCQALIQPAIIKAAMKNFLYMSSESGIPDKTLSYQSELVQSLSDKSHVIEEFLGFDRFYDADIFAKLLERKFTQIYGKFGFITPSFEVCNGGYQDSIDLARHRITYSDCAWDEICCSLVDDSFLEAVINWHPSYINSNQLKITETVDIISHTDTSHNNEEIVENKIVNIVQPFQGDSNFIFVSYSHSDGREIMPVISKVNKWGYNLWWDKGIPGGSEWDSLVEKKIEDCALVILFLGKTSSTSKFLRREVKFADVIGKPVLCVDLTDSHLSDGLKMLLSQYQRLNILTSDFYDSLKKSLKYLIP
jgi:hypothetical protein